MKIIIESYCSNFGNKKPSEQFSTFPQDSHADVLRAGAGKER